MYSSNNDCVILFWVSKLIRVWCLIDFLICARCLSCWSGKLWHCLCVRCKIRTNWVRRVNVRLALYTRDTLPPWTLRQRKRAVKVNEPCAEHTLRRLNTLCRRRRHIFGGSSWEIAPKPRRLADRWRRRVAAETSVLPSHTHAHPRTPTQAPLLHVTGDDTGRNARPRRSWHDAIVLGVATVVTALDGRSYCRWMRAVGPPTPSESGHIDPGAPGLARDAQIVRGRPSVALRRRDPDDDERWARNHSLVAQRGFPTT